MTVATLMVDGAAKIIIIIKWKNTKNDQVLSVCVCVSGRRGGGPINVGFIIIVLNHSLIRLTWPRTCHIQSRPCSARRSTSRNDGAVGFSWLLCTPLCCFRRVRNTFVVTSHVRVYRSAGAMAPSLDKSVVVLCRDDLGLWALSLASAQSPSWPSQG